VGKIAKKTIVFFLLNSALKIQYHIVKNTLLQIVLGDFAYFTFYHFLPLENKFDDEMLREREN